MSNSLALHPLPLLLLLVATTIVKKDRCCRPTSSRMTVAIERFPSTAIKRISPPSPLRPLRWCGLIRSCWRNGTLGVSTRLTTSIMGGLQIVAGARCNTGGHQGEVLLRLRTPDVEGSGRWGPPKDGHVKWRFDWVVRNMDVHAAGFRRKDKHAKGDG